MLNCDEDKIPRELEMLVRVGIETGAALAGTIQTENIGFEKMICNIVANPNIRYLVLGGPESEGHLTGEALKLLIANGVDEKKRIIESNSPHPFLYNVHNIFIERFRDQIQIIDLQFEDDPALIRNAVWSCYQEKPVDFRGYSIYDKGAYHDSPLDATITWRVTQPWVGLLDEKEQEAVKKAKELMEQLRKKNLKKID